DRAGGAPAPAGVPGEGVAGVSVGRGSALMPVPTAVHQQAQREAREERNARARRRRSATSHALAWCEAMGATVDVARLPNGDVLYTLRVPGFPPAYAIRLEWAVDALESTIRGFCESEQATHGPTSTPAGLDRLRRKRAAAVDLGCDDGRGGG